MGAMKRWLTEAVEPFEDQGIPFEVLVDRFNLAETIQTAMARRGLEPTPTALARVSGISEPEARAIVHRRLDLLNARRLLDIVGILG